ncbi:MipA/OmpV family protein [Methylobacterium dankookense]|nr:MipA/OmpV family protein [Methylobacterium dankookense]
MAQPVRPARAALGPAARWARAALSAGSALSLAAMAPVSARADDLSVLLEPRTLVSVGGLLGSGPRFPGAGKSGVWAFPYLSLRGPDEPRDWWSPDDGLDFSFVRQGPLEVGAVLDLREARSARDDRRLMGLPRLPLAPAAGLFAEVWPVEGVLRLRAEVTQGLRERDGVVAKIGADVVAHLGRFTLSGGPRLVVGDTAAERLAFDVPVRSALLNPLLAPYRAAAGPRSIGATGAVSYDWSESWQVLAYLRYDRMIGSAGASPIVRRTGRLDEVTVGTGLIHTFAVGQ